VKVDVAFTPAEVRGGTGGRTVVVVDVLRATSTIIHALAGGARSILPVAGVEEAARKAEALGRDSAMLCGERDTQPISGFELGNSPLEFTAERIGGRTLVMTTTNGTAALLAATGAERCYVGAMLNVAAVAARLREEGGDALLLCAGREGAFAAEDALCAGRILRLLRAAGARLTGNDAAAAAWRLARTTAVSRVLERSAAGRRLKELDRGEDIAFCARADVYTVVPVFDELRITL
jgi:2-phosphosulfolactate phosphatase